jgi:hypothetical protein
VPFRSPLWLVLSVLLVGSVPTWTPTAWAQEQTKAAEQREAAKQAYQEGKRSVAAGRFSRAYEQFSKAHKLIPTPQTQYWMAFCLDKLGRAKEALAAYEEFLVSPFRGRVGEDKVETAKQRQKKLKAELAERPKGNTSAKGEPGRQSETRRAGAAGSAARRGADRSAAKRPKGEQQPEPIDGATFAVRVRSLEQRIDSIQERVRRSHTRLSLLSEAILATGVGGARAAIRFRNDLSTAFRIERVLFVLDGAVQFNQRYKTAKLSDNRKLSIFTGALPPGDHTVQVLLQLRGHGYGVFSYLEGYRLDLKWSHSFTVTAGKTVDLTVIAFEKGGVTTPLHERPAVRYIEKLRTGRKSTTTRVAPAKK